MTDEFWNIIAENYLEERESLSAPYFSIDKLLEDLSQKITGKKILDYGAGIGTHSSLFGTNNTVYAFEPNQNMWDALTSGENLNFTPIKSTAEIPAHKHFDLIICSNVLPHVEDLEPIASELSGLLAEEGMLFISIPHPMKDFGYWDHDKQALVITNYLKEGIVFKNRNDSKGTPIINSIPRHHRKISTYLTVFAERNLVLKWAKEPSIDQACSIPKLEKGKLVPYFMVFLFQKINKDANH